MKKIFAILFITVITTGTFAQTDSSTGKMPEIKSREMIMGDCVMMKDGKMMAMKNGQTKDMDKAMTLDNGTTVMQDGTVKMAAGKTMMMKDDDCIYMNGKMSKMQLDKMTANRIKSNFFVN